LLSAKTILRDLAVDTWIRGCPTEQSKEEERNDENKYGQTPPKHDALLFQMRNDTLGSPKMKSQNQTAMVRIFPNPWVQRWNSLLRKSRWKVRAFTDHHGKNMV